MKLQCSQNIFLAENEDATTYQCSNWTIEIITSDAVVWLCVCCVYIYTPWFAEVVCECTFWTIVPSVLFQYQRLLTNVYNTSRQDNNVTIWFHHIHLIWRCSLLWTHHVIRPGPSSWTNRLVPSSKWPPAITNAAGKHTLFQPPVRLLDWFLLFQEGVFGPPQAWSHRCTMTSRA